MDETSYFQCPLMTLTERSFLSGSSVSKTVKRRVKRTPVLLSLSRHLKAGLIASAIASAILFMPVRTASQDLPAVHLSYASYAVSSDGNLAGYFGEKSRVQVKSLSKISKHVVNALIATEDRDFYEHDGVSLKGLGRAIIKTLTGSKQGGSTITMQLARNLFLTREQTISRKLTEIEMAYKIERKYSKDEILLMYLNTVYFGHGAYGIWAAAQEYFSKPPERLSITESAMIVGLLKSPSGYDPTKNPQKALERRNEVLYNLVEVGKISKDEFKKYKKQPLGLKVRRSIGAYFLEQVRREAVAIVSKKGMTLKDSQLKITTTMDYEVQKAADDAVYYQYSRFPSSMNDAQIALVSVEPGTGRVLAMVGGSPKSSPLGLNRAVQSRRQPGSSFKPFLYASLLEKGYTLATPLLDAPLSIDDGSGTLWTPENSTNSYRNQNVSMMTAIQHSINTAAARAITELTSPDSVASFARRMGIESELTPYPSLALGTSDVTALEMASSMAVFASSGYYAKPYTISRIEDRNGRVLYSSSSETKEVLDSATCFLATEALRAVVDSGTASSVRRHFSGTAAGKTGTTQNSTDAWFVGYNPRISTAIWMGFDDPKRKLSGGFQYGGSACAPVWANMMYEIAKTDRKYSRPSFPRPEAVQMAELCEDSGEPAAEGCIHKKFYPVNFLLLKGSCHIHNRVIGRRN